MDSVNVTEGSCTAQHQHWCQQPCAAVAVAVAVAVAAKQHAGMQTKQRAQLVAGRSAQQLHQTGE
jgi:hypothetical protein